MVHWHCGQATRQQAHRHLLQQWQLFILNELENLTIKTAPTTRLPFTTTTTRRAFSTCSCRGEYKSMSQPLETTEIQIPWEKRMNLRRIPHHQSAKLDAHILPPQSMSSAITIRSHLENGDRTKALEAFEAIAHLPPREYGIPRVIAQQLLACLRADIRAEGHHYNHHNNSKNVNKNNRHHRHRNHYKAQQLQRRYHRQLELLLTHVRSLGYFWDDNEFRVILELLDRMDMVERAEVIFRNRDIYCDQPMTIFTYNKLAAAYLRRIKHADHDKREQMRYMDKLESLIKSATTKHGLKLDVVTFNLLLSARARVLMEGGVIIAKRNSGSNLQAVVESTFQEMEKQSVKPNDRTLNIALDIYGKLEMDPLLLQGNKEMDHRLSALLKSMEKEQGQGGPDVVTYATSIRNAVLQRDMRTAEKTFRAMVEKGVMPNEFVFSHLVVGYVQLGDMEKAHQVIRLMQKAPFGLRPTVHVFSPIIQGYAKSFEYDKAYSIFSEMVDQGIPANLTTYTILATMFVDSPIYENPVQAIHILRGLSKLSLSSSSLSTAAASSVQIEEVLDQAALTVLIEAHGLAGARDLDAITKSNDSDSTSNNDDGKWRQQQKNEETSSSLSRRELHAQAAKECYDIIVQHYNKPDHLAHTALLTSYARLCLPEKAWGFWQQLKQSETPLTTIHYNALFMGLANLRPWYPTAKKTFDEMLHHANNDNSYGHPTIPDVATFDLLIQGAFQANDLDWIRHLWHLPSRPHSQEGDDDSSCLLVRTYYFALYSMVAAEDLHGAKEIFKEFKKLPHLPASATVWSQRIHQLAYQQFSSKLE